MPATSPGPSRLAAHQSAATPAGDFEYREGGAVLLTEAGRKVVLAAWQERKKQERIHPFLEEKAPLGLVPFLQAQMPARHLRGDLDVYPPWFWKWPVLVLVTYDVSTSGPGGAGRLRRVAKACRDYGQRVQYSVFEIEVDPAQRTMLKARLESIIAPSVDSLRYYYLGAGGKRRVEHVGAKPAAEGVRAVFGLDCRVIADPLSGKPLMLPIGRHRMLADRS